MRATYDEHRAKVADIREYIKVLQSVAGIPGDHPEEASAQELKTFITMPQKRSYDYSLIIITLYGIFESYVEKMMCAYLNALRLRVNTYADLPDALRRKHIELSTKLIGTNSTKYGEIRPSVIIANLNSCLNQESEPYQLNVEAFRQHSSNFRKDALREFFIQAGAENVQEYITKDSQLTGFIRKTMGEDESEEKLPFSKYFEMLDDLIERRNVVAHGSEVDDLLSFDYLDQYAEYISLLMAPIYEALLYDYYCITIKANTVNTLGLPIKVFNNSIVCINSSHYGIKVGDTLIGMNSQGEIQWGAIQSIEIDGKRVQEVPSLQAVNVGMVVPFKAKDIYTYYHHPEGNP